MTAPLLIQSIEHGVLTLVLNRPNVLNSVNSALSAELLAALLSAKAHPEIRAVLLSGAGRGFCAGQDLEEAAELARQSELTNAGLGEIVERSYNQLVRAIRYLEKPVVCAVHGVAAGAGANLALACDIVLAAEDATLVQAFSKIGLIPDTGGTFFLPRLVGLPRATALMMLAEKVSGAQAAAMGMIYRAVPSEQLLGEATQIARRLATMPTRGLGLTKRLLNRASGSDLEGQLEAEAKVQSEAGMTADFREGVAAFLEKRSPNFVGK